MLPLKIKGTRKRYCLPTSWGEIPISTILRLPDLVDDPNAFVQLLIGCPLNVDVTAVIPLLGWMQEEIDLADFTASEDPGIPVMREHSWGQLIQFSQILEQKQPLTLIGHALALYYPETMPADWMGKSLTEVYPIYLNLLNQLEDIRKLEKRLESEPTQAQKAAGIDRFKELGYMNQIDMVAQGDVTKYEAVLAIDYNTIFTKLLQIKISNTFAEDYRRIITQK